MGEEREVGRVTRYFGKIGVAAVKATARIARGDALRFRGHTTDVQMTVDSMQIEAAVVDEIGPGDEVGIRVPGKVREGDVVYKLEP